MQLIRGMGPLEEEFGARGVAFLLVNAFEEEAAARAFLEREKVDLPLAFADDAALEALGVRMVPAQVLLDGEGRVAWTSDLGSVAEGIPALRRALEGVAGR